MNRIFDFLPNTTGRMKPSLFLLNLGLVVIFLGACKKHNDTAGNGKPQVVIDSLKLSGFNTVVIFISLKNFSTQTAERGVCWSTAPDPTLQANKKTNAGLGAVFSDTITGLLPSTLYHIRSYATTEGNVTYSGDVTISTKNIAVVFDKMYAGNSDSPYIIGVVGDEVAGFVVCAHVSRKIGSGRYTRLTKLDVNGNVVWTRNQDDGTWKEPFLIRQLPDGFLVGSQYYQSGDIRVLLQKYDASGNFLWERQFKKDASQAFIRLAVRDNDFLLTMKTLNGVSSTDPAYRIGLWDFIVDKSGSVTSEKEYPNFTTFKNSTSWYHAIETPDKGFVGYCDSVYNVGCCGGDNDFEVERFGPQNALKWKKTFGGSEYEYIVKGVAASDGNYTVSGVRYNQANTTSRAWIIKVNGENGSMLWEKYYGSENANSFTSIGDLLQYSGSYYLAGTISGPNTYLVKLDESGNKTWEYFIAPQNGYNLVTPQTIYVTDNHDIYLFGIKNNDQSNPGNLFMMKLKE